MRDRRGALIGFLFHAPGLRLSGRRIPPALLRANAVALVLTILAAVAAAARFEWPGALAAWAVGHFAWSVYLARAVWRGALSDVRAR